LILKGLFDVLDALAGREHLNDCIILLENHYGLKEFMIAKVSSQPFSGVYNGYRNFLTKQAAAAGGIMW
jgi:hypothetical protein